MMPIKLEVNEVHKISPNKKKQKADYIITIKILNIQ